MMDDRSNTTVTLHELQPGDILACWGTDRVARFVSLMTSNPLAPRGLRFAPSHVAVVCDVPGEGLLWVESTTLSDRPCVINKERFAGVQAHRPGERLGEYLATGGRVDVYRLSAIDTLTEAESEHLKRILIDRFVKKRLTYDYGGALISGTRIVRRIDGVILRRFRNLHEVFCSELITAALQRLCRMNRSDATQFNPGRLCRTLVREGTYQRAGQLAFPDYKKQPAIAAGTADRREAA